jgi:hypothetical protein
MNAQAGTRPGVTRTHCDVGRFGLRRRREEAPEGGGAVVTDERRTAGCHDRCHLGAPRRAHGANEVDAAVELDESAGSEAVVDAVFRDPRAQQLRARNDTVLAGGQAVDSADRLHARCAVRSASDQPDHRWLSARCSDFRSAPHQRSRRLWERSSIVRSLWSRAGAIGGSDGARAPCAPQMPARPAQRHGRMRRRERRLAPRVPASFRACSRSSSPGVHA